MGVPVAGVSVALPLRSLRPERVAPGAIEAGAPGGILTTEGTPTTGPALGGLARTSGLGPWSGWDPLTELGYLYTLEELGMEVPVLGPGRVGAGAAKVPPCLKGGSRPSRACRGKHLPSRSQHVSPLHRGKDCPIEAVAKVTANVMLKTKNRPNMVPSPMRLQMYR